MEDDRRGVGRDQNNEIFVVLHQIVTTCVNFFIMVNIFCLHRRRTTSRNMSNEFRKHYSLLRKILKRIEYLCGIINLSDEDSMIHLRMTRAPFARLVFLIETSGGLRATRNSTTTEQVVQFLTILAHHTKNRVVKSNYKCSTRTISKHFHNVLNVVLKVHPLLLIEPEPVDASCTDGRWSPFKDCLGALDGTYIPVTVPKCDTGQYYLCDNGYTNGHVFLTPYRGVRYHVDEWAVGYNQPHNKEEYFNMKHCKDMEGDNMSMGSTHSSIPSSSHRRSWSPIEEKILINALNEIVAEGWKSKNGFMSGNLGCLEKIMRRTLPRTDLKADPHISSKIHVWKKIHGSLTTILSRSGISWVEETHMLFVEDENFWNDYVRTDNYVKRLRNKSFPYFNDWNEVFGKDRTTGKHTEDIGTAAAINLGVDDEGWTNAAEEI